MKKLIAAVSLFAFVSPAVLAEMPDTMNSEAEAPMTEETPAMEEADGAVFAVEVDDMEETAAEAEDDMAEDAEATDKMDAEAGAAMTE